MTEAEFQRTVIEMAQRFHWRVAHFKAAPTPGERGWATPVSADGKGFPDLVMLREGRMVVAELKSEKGRTSTSQDAWLRAFALCAGAVVRVWRPSMLDEVEKVLR